MYQVCHHEAIMDTLGWGERRRELELLPRCVSDASAVKTTHTGVVRASPLRVWLGTAMLSL